MTGDIKNFNSFTVFRAGSLAIARSRGPLNIVVGGASRGGTSAVGLVLRVLGCQMGANVHPSTHEDLDFVDLVNNGNFDNTVWRDLAAQRIESFPDWNIKLPAAFQMLHIWENVLPNPFYIVVMRNPFSVARSLIKWDECYEGNAIDYFNGYSHAISMYAECLGRIGEVKGSYCICEYEKIIADPVVFVQNILEICGFSVDNYVVEKCAALLCGNGYKEVA